MNLVSLRIVPTLSFPITPITPITPIIPIGPNLPNLPKFLKLLNLSNVEFTLTFLLRLRLPPHIPSGRVPISRQTWRMR